MGEGHLERELKEWVTHPNFKPAVKEFQDQLRAGEPVRKENAIFYNQIVKIMTRHRDRAVSQLKLEFPELEQEILTNRIGRNNQRRGTAADTIDYSQLVDFPLK
jgi:hypothetical protein